MKVFNFILQSKGGSGKSFLTYLFGLKHQKNSEVLFVDLDHSTKTSISQLNFLAEQQRVAHISLFGERDKQDRQLLIKMLVDLNELPFDTYYLDFGAPEAEQFPSLLKNDFDAETLQEIEQALSARFIFNCVVAGNTAFKPCMLYLRQLHHALEQRFSLNIYLNEFLFAGPAEVNQRAFLDTAIKDLGLSLIRYGNMDNQGYITREIVHNAQTGKGMEAYGPIHRIVVNKLLKDIE